VKIKIKKNGNTTSGFYIDQDIIDAYKDDYKLILR